MMKWPHLAPALVHIGAIYAPNILRELRDLVFWSLDGWEAQSLCPDKALVRWLLEPKAVGRDGRWWELFVDLQEKLVEAQNRGDILITVATGLSTAEQLMPGVLPNTRSLLANAWEWAPPLDFARNTVRAAGNWWPVVAVEWLETEERVLQGPSLNKPDFATLNTDRQREKYNARVTGDHVPTIKEEKRWAKDQGIPPESIARSIQCAGVYGATDPNDASSPAEAREAERIPSEEPRGNAEKTFRISALAPGVTRAAQGRGGRKKGSGAIDDTPRLRAMLDLLVKGQALSVHHAARKIAKSMLVTSQSRDADVSRLRGKFAKAHGTEPPTGKTWGDVAAELTVNGA
jgi:hypothetical protein